MTTPYIDPNLIFAENAPVQDKPAAFSNYDKGWDESRTNDGRPLIPQMNYLTQQADLKNLYIHENGAALPYKEGITYEENAVVVKDGVLQQWRGGEWVVVGEQEVKKYLLAAGITEAELDGEYNYLMQRLAQIAVDKGWDASFVVDGDRNQKQINDDVYNSINVFTKRNNGFISILEFIPDNLHQYLKDFTTSLNFVGDLSTIINDVFNHCEAEHLDLIFPFGYYFTSRPIYLPRDVRVVGLGHPYILATKNFVGEYIVSADKSRQDVYYFNGFQINGEIDVDVEGLRIGGCRNSVFSDLKFTSCRKNSIRVFPTHPDSGDVENVELDHIWTVLCGSLKFENNPAIAQGNITDGRVTNCQLTSGDQNSNTGPVLELKSATGKHTIGLKFDRIFTKTTSSEHIVIDPNGGEIYSNSFTDFSGETWKLGGNGGPQVGSGKDCMIVRDGIFCDNRFSNFYRVGLQGDGITLGNGSTDNAFDGLTLVDHKHAGYNNRWLTLPPEAKRNRFINVAFRESLYENGMGSALSANDLFSHKIRGGIGNFFESSIVSSKPTALIKRSHIFELNTPTPQLKNYPVAGCGFYHVNGNLQMVVPAGSNPHTLYIPFSVLPDFYGDRVSVYFRYKITSVATGLNFQLVLGNAAKNLTELQVGVTNSMQFTAPYSASAAAFTLTISGTRPADYSFIIEDIVITQGESIPFNPNYEKLYIES